jgi:tRNA dimethylallyltransferase
LVVLGPTASGKTALSLHLAERFGGEIVNCDSVAVYRRFDIGTAKPSAAERGRAPHHLLDIRDPDQELTAGEYSRLARQVLAEVRERGRVPIVAGGTGFYLRALLEGLFEAPQKSEELRRRLRHRAETGPSDRLHKLLRRLDPEAAAAIHANDTAKLIRAIEVCLLTGERMSKLWERGRDPLLGFRIMRLGLDPERDALYGRINQRCEQMFAAGLLEETRAILHDYSPPSAPEAGKPVARALASLGYKQAVQLLRGEIDRAQALAGAQQGHRNYAKRQKTWFRAESEVHWLSDFGDAPAVLAAAEQLAKGFLQSAAYNQPHA